MADEGLRLLLDTHVLVWQATEPDRVPDAIIDSIGEESNAKFVSAATAWEIEAKRAAGRLKVSARLVEGLRNAGYLELPLRFEHAVEARRLPPIHGDPFDRMLVAQARVEGLTIVSADRQIARYDVPVLAVG